MNDHNPVNEHRFPCDNCGADFRFDPKTGGLACDHCGHTSDIGTASGTLTAIRELDLRNSSKLSARYAEALGESNNLPLLFMNPKEHG